MGIDFAPSTDEAARKIHFTYGNKGSLPGQEIQDWLEAGTRLLTEHNRTRVLGFKNKTGMHY